MSPGHWSDGSVLPKDESLLLISVDNKICLGTRNLGQIRGRVTSPLYHPGIKSNLDFFPINKVYRFFASLSSVTISKPHSAALRAAAASRRGKGSIKVV